MKTTLNSVIKRVDTFKDQKLITPEVADEYNDDLCSSWEAAAYKNMSNEQLLEDIYYMNY